uniref:NADH-ubiquinone oxidoreductase chain 2 n=1 Tax=Meghimatium bilineatum TaxID=318265 RepID=A0A218KBP3_9EUPU|nr:NADH dehydrogenase subunit 2 [Meghimatium bilineatum]AKK32358.1 NADH dehydrogenase subunit 2 [Meghimatium bilineatum]
MALVTLFIPLLMMILTTSNWFYFWALMEIVSMSVVLFITSKNKLFSENAMTLFIIQAVSGLLILVGGTYVQAFSSNGLLWVTLLLGILLKLGLAPLHFWVLPLMGQLDYISIFFVLGPAKIPPLSLLCLNFSYQIVLFFSLFSMITGSLLGLKVTNVKSIIGASSITHTGWVFFSNLCNFMWSYFTIYLMSTFFLLVSLSKNQDLLSGLNLLSMSGLPPFGLFLAKVYLLSVLMMYFNPFFVVILLVTALLSLYFYLKFAYKYWLKSMNSKILSMKGVYILGMTHMLTAVLCIFFYGWDSSIKFLI